MVDTIDPLLGFNNDASKLRHLRVLTRDMLLACLDANCSFGVVACVQLNALLVGSNIELNTSLGRGHGEQNQILSLRGGVSRSVHYEGVVVAGTVVSASVQCLQDILADLLGGAEVIGRVGGSEKLSSGNFDIVNTDVARGVWHSQSVVQDSASFLTDKSTKVPVDVVGKHYGGGLVEGNGDQSRRPSRSCWVR